MKGWENHKIRGFERDETEDIALWMRVLAVELWGRPEFQFPALT